MNRLHRIFVLGIFCIFGMVGLVAPMSAALDTGIGEDGIAGKSANLAGFSSTDEFTLSMIVGLIIRFLFGFFGIIFTLLVLYAGFNWMTAQGDSGQVESAQQTVQQAIIGMVICLSGYSISNFVLKVIFG